jgi:hypothetical protein
MKQDTKNLLALTPYSRLNSVPLHWPHVSVCVAAQVDVLTWSTPPLSPP